MIDLLTVAADEVTKLAAASAYRAAGTGGRKVLDLIRRRFGGDVPADLTALRASVIAAGEDDEEWRTQLLEALAVLNGDRTPVATLPAPEPFRNYDAVLADPPSGGIHVITGRRGAGKTALARRIAEQVRDDFPSGTVELSLDEFRDGDAFDADAAKRRVLGALGLAEPEILVDPQRLDQQYTSVLLTRKCVLLLDNARTAAEAELLARAPANLVLVIATSLTRELRATRWPVIPLTGLEPDGARALLADACRAPDLPAAEPEATEELLELCGRLPDAIIAAGTTLSYRAGERGAVAGLLAEYARDGITDAESAIADSLRRTFESLPVPAVRASVLLAEHPGGMLTRRSAVALIGGDHPEDAFRALVDANLLEPRGNGWFRPAALVLDYAPRFGARWTEERDAAFDRVLGYFRDHAVAADLRDGPDRLRGYLVHSGLSWTLPGDPVDWLEDHREVLVDLVRRANRRGRHEEVCQLAGAFEVLLNKRGYWGRYAEVADCYVGAATALAERDGSDQRFRFLARARSMRARAGFLARLFPSAEADLRAASELVAALDARERDNRRLAASVREFTGRLIEERYDTGLPVGLGAAAGEFTAAIGIDRELDDRRALGIHLRMLARVLVKAGRPADALPVLEEALRYNENRNLGAVYLVAARAYLALRNPAAARRQLDTAAAILDREVARQYWWERAEIAAHLALAEGDARQAERRWAELVDAAFHSGHPRANGYLAEFNRLCR